MIITIARQCGCMGDQIGKALAEKYFIPFYDKDAVCRLAKEKGLYEKYPYFYGEMPLDMMLYADTMAGDDTSDNGKTPRKAMADIIGNENCVVVGKQCIQTQRRCYISISHRKQRKKSRTYRKEAQCQP